MVTKSQTRLTSLHLKGSKECNSKFSGDTNIFLNEAIMPLLAYVCNDIYIP